MKAGRLLRRDYISHLRLRACSVVPPLTRGMSLAAPDPGFQPAYAKLPRPATFSLAADAGHIIPCVSAAPGPVRRWLSRSCVAPPATSSVMRTIGSMPCRITPAYGTRPCPPASMRCSMEIESISSMASFRVPARSCPIRIAFGVAARVVVDAQRNLELSIRAER